MVTKEQERAALLQIEAIIDSLGKGSYVGTAFDGCIQDARDNIEFDFCLSMKDRLEIANNDIKQHQEAEQTLRKTLADEATLCAKRTAELAMAETELDQKKDEVVRLKAKLYDIMMEKGLSI